MKLACFCPMNRKVIIIILALILTASVSFAAVLTYYLKINGSMETIAPEFYVDSVEEENLLVNEKPSDSDSFTIQGTHRTFKTEQLEGVNFGYVPKVKFYVRTSVGTTTPQDLILNFGYINGSNNIIPICSKTITVTDTIIDYVTDYAECSEIPSNVKKFYYEFEKVCLDCEYTINNKSEGGFYTKVDLNK